MQTNINCMWLKKNKITIFGFIFFISITVTICLQVWSIFHTKAVSSKLSSDTLQNNNSPMIIVPNIIINNDDAVRRYLDMAQIHARIYNYTNNNSYSGLCEISDDLYTLEGGILKFIKMVGATEVFCSTSATNYLIEAQLPGNKMFYCIDNSGTAIEQGETKEGSTSCT